MSTNYKEIDPEKYMQMLGDLLDKGQLYNKSSVRYSYKWPSLKLCTEDDNGAVETTAEFDPDIYIMFDSLVYPDKSDRRQVLGQVINSFSQKLYDQQDLNGVDWQGADVYTMEGKKFRADYDLNGDVAKPNADAMSSLRLCLDVKEAVNWPCAWGDFPIGKGGTIAMSQADIEDVRAALVQLKSDLTGVDDKSIRQDLIQRALYQDDGNAKFDVYGMKPGFRIQNYDLYQNKEGQLPTPRSKPQFK